MNICENCTKCKTKKNKGFRRPQGELRPRHFFYSRNVKVPVLTLPQCPLAMPGQPRDHPSHPPSLKGTKPLHPSLKGPSLKSPKGLSLIGPSLKDPSQKGPSLKGPTLSARGPTLQADPPYQPTTNQPSFKDIPAECTEAFEFESCVFLSTKTKRHTLQSECYDLAFVAITVVP